MNRAVSQINVPEELAECQTPEASIGVGDQLSPGEVVNLAIDYKLRQLVQRSHPESHLEMKTAELMLQHPSKFMNFPVSAILNPEQVSTQQESSLQIFTKEFTKASHKTDLLTEIEAILQTVKVPKSKMQDILLSVDEMVTNAIYNAPYVNFELNGPGVQRDKAHGERDDLKAARVFVGSNGQRLVVGYMDSYGTLNPLRLLERLRACYTNGPKGAMNWAEGGAGIGTYMIFQAALAYYVGVIEGQKTVVACTYSLSRDRSKQEVPKNLHLATNVDPEDAS